jgi:hypothetical protein
MEQLTKEQAIAFYDNRNWEQLTTHERAMFQIEQDLLCIPFDKFHEAVEETLGRPVWTHEFANRDRLRAELEGKAKAPSFAQILAMLPPKKTIVIVHGGG